MNSPFLDNGPKYRQVLDSLRGEILSGRYRPGEKFPSEADLVKRFGASRITVGRAVRELRDEDLIERRAGSGSYVRAVNTSGLTFGLLIPNLGQTEIFEPICRGMADATQGDRHALLWGNSPESASRGEQALKLSQQYVDRRVSGVFFAPLEHTREDEVVNRRVIESLTRARIPVVLLDRCFLPYPQRSRYDLVGIDNRRAGYLATEHLLHQGVKRIGFLTHAHAASTVGARISGYREALFFHGAEVRASLIHRVEDLQDTAILDYLEREKPGALVCSNDHLAAGIMQTLLAHDIRIPEDIRIVGIDNVSYAGLVPVPLTTIQQPSREIGMTAMETMLSRIARPDLPTRDVLLATRLIVRKSCGSGLTGQTSHFEAPQNT